MVNDRDLFWEVPIMIGLDGFWFGWDQAGSDDD
jgi:hypothetical protein